MNKKFNKYKLTLEELELKDQTTADKSINFNFENHDDLFKILEFAKNSNRFENPNDNIEFFIGLKLFSEVMLRNKSNPLFTDFLPNFMELMKNVKGKAS